MSYDHDGAGVSPETFQEIITERQAERRQNAELKRIHDQKIIEEGKSETGVHPLDIFPQEIWEVIFSRLPPEGRANLWEVHEVFSTFISRIQDIIFPLIFKEKVKQFWGNSASDDVVPLGHYLELRRLSKGMRNAVDRFLKEDLLNCLRHPESSKKPKKTTKFSSNNMEFTSNSKFFRRFPSNSLRVKIKADHDPAPSHLEGLEHFKSKLVSFLKHFGKQIWHFQFIYDKWELELICVYFIFLECLSLMPNMKWLQVNIDCHTDFIACESAIEALRNHPLPMLQDLERIEFGKDRALEANFFYGAVLGANPHIKHLNMIRWEKYHLEMEMETLLHLESLIVMEPNTFWWEDESNEGGERALSRPPRFEKYFHFMAKNMVKANAMWSLKRLGLDVSLHGDSIIAVLKFLQKFPSLEQVSLTLKEVTLGGGIDFLKLPNLKEFDLQFNAKILEHAPTQLFFSLQFLLYCDKLKKLKWHDESVDRSDPERHMEDLKEYGRSVNMIDFKGGLAELGDKRNNIWKVFPQLEYVVVSVLGKGDDGSWGRFLKKYRRGELQ